MYTYMCVCMCVYKINVSSRRMRSHLFSFRTPPYRCTVPCIRSTRTTTTTTTKVDAASTAIPRVRKRQGLVLRSLAQAPGRARSKAAGAASRESGGTLGEVRQVVWEKAKTGGGDLSLKTSQEPASVTLLINPKVLSTFSTPGR